MGEFYFDYKIESVENGLGIKESEFPKLYVERDYYAQTVHYAIYMTFSQWNADVKKEDRLFDEVYFSYDDWGLDPTVFEENANISEYVRSLLEKVNEKISYDEYKKEYRYVISDSEWKDFSGVGAITLKKSGTEQQTTLYVAVNFAMKNKIYYRINEERILFQAEGAKEQIKVRVYYSDERYPCLEKDVQSDFYKELLLDFSDDGKCSFELDEIAEGIKSKKLHVAFDPNDVATNRYYLLECIENDSVCKDAVIFELPEAKKFCPYCHEEIKTTEEFTRKYKKDGVGCDGSQIYKDGKFVSVHKNEKGKRLSSGVLYCANDFGGGADGKIEKFSLSSTFTRLLPDKFLERKNFKIVVVGANPSEKFAFLSRLFSVVNDENKLEITAETLKNLSTKKKCVLRAEPVGIRCLNETARGALTIGSAFWQELKGKGKDFYEKYAVDLGKDNCPTSVEEYFQSVGKSGEDAIKYPFPLNVNKDNYVYFYDVVGKDAEKSKAMLEKMTQTGAVGILYLVDETEIGENAIQRWLFDKVKEAPNMPVAVALTNFNKLEKEFDGNCHCLRGDAFDMLRKTYEGSELKRNVDFASEEIKSYLVDKGLLFTDGKNSSQEVNVKYFGVSTFSTLDAVYHKKQENADRVDETVYLQHQCSAKRMELPVIWLLRQLGCII